MKKFQSTIANLFVVFIMLFAWHASADFNTNSTVVAGGYDLVSYQTDKKPLPVELPLFRLMRQNF